MILFFSMFSCLFVHVNPFEFKAVIQLYIWPAKIASHWNVSPASRNYRNTSPFVPQIPSPIWTPIEPSSGFLLRFKLTLFGFSLWANSQSLGAAIEKQKSSSSKQFLRFHSRSLRHLYLFLPSSPYQIFIFHEFLPLLLVSQLFISLNSHFSLGLCILHFLFLRLAKIKEPKSDNRIKFFAFTPGLCIRKWIYVYFILLRRDQRENRLIFLKSAAELKTKENEKDFCAGRFDFLSFFSAAVSVRLRLRCVSCASTEEKHRHERHEHS